MATTKQPADTREKDRDDGERGERFYIQNKGFCGDCLLWWRRNRCGYTTDLSEALMVGRDEAESICKDRPWEDVMWPTSLIDRLASLHLNSEHLNAHLRRANA